MTRAPVAIRNAANKIVNALGANTNAWFSGIVGDRFHSFGYHLSPNDCPSNDYSLQLSRDKNSDLNAASGLDIKLIPTLMKKVTAGLRAAALRNDPRLNVLREFCGTLDLEDTFHYDLSDGTTDSSWDDSHLWHMHFSGYRSEQDNDSGWDSFADLVIECADVNSELAQASSHLEEHVDHIWQDYPTPDVIREGTGNYYGSISGDERSLGGYYGPVDEIRVLQQRLIACGFVPGITDPNSDWADGVFDTPQDAPGTGETSQAVGRFQDAHMPGTTFRGQCWYDDWQTLFTL